ncbi:tubulin-specific chaperone C [Drosophila grimshawi]|uniref:GH10233 n=1 Tax=Drosophila grimshawi TaxID=7222 RepID=B4JB72_DROGR|nr:tubulin-specific chaperone C [Drosophila grimshawi]EDW03964.1 GH10233 [Drosophila grimshawi]
MESQPNVDSVDDAAAVARKDFMLERLNKRNKDRQNYLDVKLEQRSKETVQNEGVDYFATCFNRRAYEIEERINALDRCGDAPLPDLGKHFAEITMEIQELQRYLTTSTMFLSDFKIKSCQNVLNTLSGATEEARQRFMPKKKFGFSSKKTTTAAVKQKLPQKKLDKTGAEQQKSTFSWTISDQRQQHIVLRAAEVDGLDITISNVANCLVELQGHPGSVQISNATQCTVLSGPVARSFFAEHLQQCTLAIACQQLRLHSSQATRIYLHVTCRAIIEDSQQIEIDVYNYDYPQLEADYLAAGLNKSQNNYMDVADFNWLSPDVHSPNWTVLKDHPAPNWSAKRTQFLEGINKADVVPSAVAKDAKIV